MANKEIEIKYLLRDFNMQDTSLDFLKKHFGSLEEMLNRVQTQGDYYIQHYLADERAKEVANLYKVENYENYNVLRIRNITSQNGYNSRILTLKGPGNGDLEVLEEEFNLSLNEYENYLKEALYKITKRRLTLPHPYDNKFKIEFDIFCANSYLQLNNLFCAEVEGNSENELRALPLLGKDVSKEKRYKNFALAKLNGISN